MADVSCIDRETSEFCGRCAGGDSGLLVPLAHLLPQLAQRLTGNLGGRVAAQVTALAAEGQFWREHESTAALGIEDRGEKVGESRSGRGSQSIEPSRATSATVRPSPKAA